MESETESVIDSEPEVKRGPNITTFEKNLLLELVGKKKDTLENKKTDFGANNGKDIAWDELASIFNSTPETYSRKAKQLKKTWENLKRSAKKMVTKQKKAFRQTGGGGQPPDLPPDVEKVMAIIPSQMKSLDNDWDCDNEIIECSEGQSSAMVLVIQPRPEQSQLVCSPGTNKQVSKKRQDKDARSSIVDMEYEEHIGRMRTISLQQEYQKLKIKIAKRKLQIMDEQHSLQTNLITAQLAALPNVELITESN